MKILEYLGGVLVAVLTLPAIFVGMLFSTVEMPRYFKMKRM